MSLVGHWPLQDNAASTTITGVVGGNGTAARNTSLTTTTGPGGTLTNAWQGNGTSDGILLTPASLLKNVAGATLTAWLKWSSTPGSNATIMYVSINGGSGSRALLSINTSDLIFAGGRAGDAESLQQKTLSGSFKDSIWHHVAAVINYASDTIVIYVDGVQYAQTGSPSFTATATSNTDPTNASLGYTSGSSANYLGASIAGCRIYDTTLTQNEIYGVIAADMNVAGSSGGRRSAGQYIHPDVPRVMY